jgi:hypothetical protein
MGLVGCTQPIPLPDLGDRYNRAAQYHGPDRNPVIVIPGILGSNLVDTDTGTQVWGAFEGGAADPGRAEGARLIALPMQIGVPLRELTDGVEPDGALETIRLSLFGLPFQVEAYARILGTLGAGGYRDMQLAEAGAIDYGTDHYSCFQFAYDWRRDNVENAGRLLHFIQEKRAEVQRNLAEDFGGEAGDYDVNFDIVAHSMGGLLTRYMLRFGEADLPADGSVPEVTWAGAEHVDRVVLVGTPNAGAVNALTQLVEGAKFSPFHSGYSPAILGTMPSIYQLLPRDRHARVRQRQSPLRGDKSPMLSPKLMNINTWHAFDWGLAEESNEAALAKLLPDVREADRYFVAVDHLEKCLARAEQLHAALDQPAALPESISLTLYAGDGVPTPDTVEVTRRGKLRRAANAPGDGTVTRDSALLDERLGPPPHAGNGSPRLVTPIDWTDVNFLFTDHLGLTADAVFADNVLHLLLESPHRRPSETH